MKPYVIRVPDGFVIIFIETFEVVEGEECDEMAQMLRQDVSPYGPTVSEDELRKMM